MTKLEKAGILVLTNKEKNRLQIRFASTIKNSRFLMISFVILIVGIYLFFFLTLVDFLLDSFTAKGGFITQYSKDDQPRPASLRDLLIMIGIVILVNAMSGLVLMETSIHIDDDNIVISRRVFGKTMKKKTIPVHSVQNIKVTFEHSSHGEYAYLLIATHQKEARFQIYESDPKISEEIKQELENLGETIKEFLKKVK